MVSSFGVCPSPFDTVWCKSAKVMDFFGHKTDETNQCVVSHHLQKPGAPDYGVVLFRWGRQSVLDVCTLAHGGLMHMRRSSMKASVIHKAPKVRRVSWDGVLVGPNP